MCAVIFVPFPVCKHLAEEERAGCFTLIALHVCQCSKILNTSCLLERPRQTGKDPDQTASEEAD